MSRRLMLTALLAGLVASAAAAQATPYVPSTDAAYEDLNVLMSVGLVRNVIAGERPYSRAAFRRFVDEAKSRGVSSESARVNEAFERLSRRFGERQTGFANVAMRESRLTAAISPPRPARSGDLTGGTPGGGITADINPLLDGAEGRRVVDGGTAGFEAAASVWSQFFAAEVAPRVSVLVPRTDAGLGGYATIADAYGRAVFGAAVVEAGRNHLILGHGLSGGPLLSENARGLDMVRLGLDRPIRMPSFLGKLGLWQATLALADLGNNRKIPGSMLAVLRLSSRPSTYVELGLDYLNIQGGKGAPPADKWSRLHDMFFFWTDGGAYQISDKVAGADVRLLIPALHASLYANFQTTDDRGHFTQPAGGYWEDAVWQVGTEVNALGSEGRTDLALEWAHAGPRAHTHGQYISGVTLDRRVLGNALGPNAASITGRLSRNGGDSRLRITGVWALFSGDDYYWALIPGGGPWDFDWYRAANNPDEIRLRLDAEYLRHEGWHGLESSLRFGYEHVTRFNYGTAGRHNVVAEIVLRRSR